MRKLMRGAPVKGAMLAAGVLLMAGGAASAQSAGDAASSDRPALQGYFSMGAGMLPDYEGSQNYRPVPYADARINRGNYYLRFEGADLRMNVLDSDEFHVGPLIGYRMGRGDVGNRAVSALYHIKESLTAGGFVEWEHDHKDPRAGERVTLLLADDMTGNDTGWNATLRGVIRRPLLFVDPGLIASLEGDAVWASQNYMLSYFSVSPRDAFRSGLPQYGASAGLKSVGAAISLDQFLSRTWSVGLRFHYSRLTNDAADSPIVAQEGSPDQFFAGIVVGYVL